MSKQWIVQLECRVMKQVVCEGCTEEQAQEDPFEYAIDEMEISQIDWEVVGIRAGAEKFPVLGARP